MSKVHKEDAQWVTKYNGFNDGKSSANGVGGKKVSLQTKEITAMSKTLQEIKDEVRKENGYEGKNFNLMEESFIDIVAERFSESRIAAYKEELREDFIRRAKEAGKTVDLKEPKTTDLYYTGKESGLLDAAKLIDTVTAK